MKKKLYGNIGTVILFGIMLFGINIAGATGFDEYQLTFQKSVNEWGGECIKYVRYETGIEHSCCNGYAQNCYGQAKTCGYSTGDIPIIGSIMVMGAWGSVHTGHDAIVIAIDSNNHKRVKVRDSNWRKDHIVREHWINTDSSSYGWFKYIYPKILPTTPAPHHKVSILDTRWWSLTKDQTLSISWYPANVPCHKATSWHKNETCSAEYGNKDACQKFYDEMISIDWNKTWDTDLKTVFFGDTNDYRNLCGY